MQNKLGAYFRLNPRVGVFAEYRLFYLAESTYTFGSTSYDVYAVSTPWTVKIKPQYYNIGSVGVRVDL